MFIDTHAHLYLEDFDNDRDEMIQRAFDAGVDHILLPNVDAESIDGLVKLSDQYPNKILPMMGFHPVYVKEDYEKVLEAIKKQFDERKFCAVGEIGIDLYWDKTFKSEQEIVFAQQINWAKEYDLPIVIHARESYDEIFKVLEENWFEGLTGVFHSFTGNSLDARRIVEMGFKIGVGGIFTFKNSDLKNIMKSVSMHHIIIETDAPYLSPTPKRGQRNESAFVAHVAEHLADFYEVSVEEIGRKTSQNAKELFKI